MQGTTLAAIAGVSAAVLAFSITRPLANAPPVAANAEEITQALRGKICTTRVGATFTFGPGGRYTYDGLWKNGGTYAIGEGIVTVTLESGLERSFAISRHDDVFYMEETVLRCRAASATPQLKALSRRPRLPTADVTTSDPISARRDEASFAAPHSMAICLRRPCPVTEV